MNFTEFMFKLLFIFLPGIIYSFMVDALTMHPPRDRFFFILKSFIAGMVTYSVLYGFLLIPEIWKESYSMKFTFLRSIFDKSITPDFREIFFACLISIVLAILATFTINYKLGHKLAQRFKISNKYGEMDVWGFLFNLNQIKFVTVRDHNNNLMFDGWVRAFSDNSKEAEVYLIDVDVYTNDDATKLYHVDSLYLARKREDISIEIRENSNNDSKVNEEENSNVQ